MTTGLVYEMKSSQALISMAQLGSGEHFTKLLGTCRKGLSGGLCARAEESAHDAD